MLGIILNNKNEYIINNNNNIKMNFLIIAAEDDIKSFRIKEWKMTPLENNNPIHKSNKKKIHKHKYVNISNQTYRNILNSKINDGNLIVRRSKINNMLYIDNKTYLRFINK